MPNPLNAPSAETAKIGAIPSYDKAELLAAIGQHEINVRDSLYFHATHYLEWRDARNSKDWRTEKESVEESIAAHIADGQKLQERLSRIQAIKITLEEDGYVVRLSLP